MILVLVNPFLQETNVFHNHFNSIYIWQSKPSNLCFWGFSVLQNLTLHCKLAGVVRYMHAWLTPNKTLSIIILLPIKKWPEIDDQSGTDTKCMWNGGFVENCNQVFKQVGTWCSSTPSTMIFEK